MGTRRDEMLREMRSMLSVTDEQARKARDTIREYEQRAMEELKAVAAVVGTFPPDPSSEQIALALGEIRGRLKPLAQAAVTLKVWEEGQRQLKQAENDGAYRDSRTPDNSANRSPMDD